MTTKYLLSLDPGKQSGIAWGRFDGSTPYERVDCWRIPNGLQGFMDWYHGSTIWWESRDLVVVSERFVLRSQAFVADTTPLLIEGAMVALGMNPVWQLRTDKALVPDHILKDNELWLTGKSVGHKDARDVNDATIHALAYLKKKNHLPTLRKYWPNEEMK